MDVVVRFVRAGVEVEGLDFVGGEKEFEFLAGGVVGLDELVLLFLAEDPLVELVLELGHLLFVGGGLQLLCSDLLELLLFVQEADILHYLLGDTVGLD